MPQGLITYSSISLPKQATYTQRRGVRPDQVRIECVPQAGTIAATGDVTLSYDGSSLTIPDCVLDSGRVTLNTRGFVTSVVLHDRRELWKYAAPVNGHYNVTDQLGNRVTATEKTLRELMDLLLTALGESSRDVTAVDNSIYPEVDWQCEMPVVALQNLCATWGYDVVLGFGTEAVSVEQVGTGTTLPSDTTQIMQSSDTFDPTIQPEFVRVCFGPSVAQARFELEAVAQESDGEYVAIGSASYKPAGGWEGVDPFSMTILRAAATAAEYLKAQASMYKVYRIKQFSDGNLNLPDGSGTTLTEIQQVFPVDTRLLETETISGKTQRGPARLYGVMWKRVSEDGQPQTEGNTDIDDVLDIPFRIDQARGLVIFDRPVYKIVTGQIKPADLYLETSFQVRNNTTNQWERYEKDTTFDASGTGYATLRYPYLRAQTIVDYNTGHAANVGGNTTNQTALDTVAATATTAVAGRWTYEAGEVNWYNQPQFSIRLDGLISEVTHIVSDGDLDQPAAYTIASRNIEFDRTLMSGTERRVLVNGLNNLISDTANQVLKEREAKGND